MIIEATQRWRNGKSRFIPIREPFNPREFEVAEIREAAAKEMILTHHYLKSFPASRRRFGLFLHAKLVGVAVFSQPTNNLTITNVFNCQPADGLELGRFLLLDEIGFNAESWFLARCREVLRREYVGVVMFSDDQCRLDERGEKVFAGHLGKIYASTGSTFLGRGTPRVLRLLPDGTTFNDRTISKIRKNESGCQYAAGILERFGAAPLPEDPSERPAWLTLWLNRLTRPLKHTGCLKYAWSFSKSVQLVGLPYPKIKIGDLQPNLF